MSKSLSIACPRCAMPAGTPCVTVSGAPSRVTHRARLDLAHGVQPHPSTLKPESVDPVTRRREKPLADGQRRELKPRPHQFARMQVTAERVDGETPYVHLHGIMHLGYLDDTAYKSPAHIALEDTAVVTLIDQLQRALRILPTSK